MKMILRVSLSTSPLREMTNGAFNASSSIPASRDWMAERLRRNVSTNSGFSGIGCGPPFLRSNFPSATNFTARDGIETTCQARRPSGIDFGCGVQSSLSSGTRSSILSVDFPSNSSSAISAFASGIHNPQTGTGPANLDPDTDDRMLRMQSQAKGGGCAAPCATYGTDPPPVQLI